MEIRENEQRRADNLIWNAAGDYSLVPWMRVYDAEGRAELYWNSIVGAAFRRYDRNALRSFSDSFGRDDDRISGHIDGITDGTTVGFKYFDCRGVRQIGIETRAYAHGKMQIRLSPDGEILAEIPIESSNVWHKGVTDVSIPDGQQALYLTYRGTGKTQLNSVTLIR